MVFHTLSPMSIFVKVESADEIEKMSAVAGDIWRAYFTPLIGVGQVAYMLDKFQSVAAVTKQIRQGYCYYIVMQDDSVVGYFCLVPDPETKRVMISKIYLHAHVRGAGYGSKIFQFIKTYARARAAKILWLTVYKYNESAIAWYCQKGFCTIDSVEVDIGGGYVMNDYIMEYQL